MKSLKATLAASACCVVLTSCGHVAKMRGEIEEQRAQTKQAMDSPVKVVPEQRVVKNDKPLVPLVERTLPRAGSWLRSKNVSISVSNSVALSQVVEMFATRGVAIISEIPLDNIYYAGTVPATDAETALQIILGSCGLDFVVDETARIVRIKPMPSRTWYLNLGQRRSRYATGGSTGSSTPAPSSSSVSSGLASATGSGTPAASPSSGSTGPTGELSISATDDFWTSLHTELERRLNLLVPAGRGPRNLTGKLDETGKPAASGGNPGGGESPAASASTMYSGLLGGGGNSGQANAQNQQAPAAPAGTQDLYARKLIGSYSTNPETGSITVQAPHWVLADLDAYLNRVQQMYNTDITFTGELVLVNKNRKNSEGLDLAAFALYARKFGAVVANNALGGVTVNFAQGSNIPGVATAGTDVIGGTRIGVIDKANGLQIFNAWLAETGDTSVIQRPVVSTTSGMPAEFSKTVTRFYNTVNQQTAAGGVGSAAVGTQNNLVPVNLGTTMKINPRFDMSSGLIRAQISFSQSVQSEVQKIVQKVTAGTELKDVDANIPVVTQISYSGETLLRDGDLIIIGGQTEEDLSTAETGLPEGAGELNTLLGTRSARRAGGTYYLALRVQITPR